ncbi:MAG: hypothetical protein Q4E46_02080 [Candidatus Saccharibacteria bacterium]|nr:hypothetical protein [Candidatus Saccharibacteria bacterium]
MQRKIFAILLTLIMAFSLTSVTAFAAEVEPPADDPIVPEEYTASFYTDIWTTMYTGNGKAVVLEVTNTSNFFACSIRMIGYDGSQLWRDPFDIAAQQQKNYYVGRNVARVEIKGVLGMGSVSYSKYIAE